MNLGTFLAAFFQGLKNNTIIAAIPAVITFLQNTAGLNPMTQPLEYIAQLELLRATLNTKIPGLVLEEVQALNSAISAHLQTVLSDAQAANAALLAAANSNATTAKTAAA